ncbi:MAG: hypothetical protein GX591_11190 [Planctomycetes bacterium]|nr:hypothetical protein [Planctomycetota bacterium]
MTKRKKDRKALRARQRAKHLRPACGLCGNTENLMRTDCCGNWICNDEHKYVLFSYEPNSCHRNHRRQTLCAFHYAEGHEGRWQDCPRCRDAFETEMYVWYGTNEYNFEKLPNPPAYEPTACRHCGRIIILSEGGYSVKGDDYLCPQCSDDLFAVHGDGFSPGRITGEAEELGAVDPQFEPNRYAELVALLDPFCDAHLNDEYRQFCREMAVEICCEDSAAMTGKAESWAAGIVYALGQVNSLTDPARAPHMKTPDIAKGFGVAVSTMQGKAKIIREMLNLRAFDPKWTVPGLVDQNP